MRDSSLYLKDVLQAIESIEAFVEGMDFESYQADDKTASAVVRKLEIIGEAVKQLPEELTRPYPDIPWKQVAGMRDKLIHSYFGVDPALVWRTVRRRLPALKATVREMLENRTAP